MTVAEYNHTVNQLSDRIYRFALKMVKDESTAQDVVQDSYERLWVNKNKVEMDKAKAYLFKVCYHLFIDKKRKEKRETLSDDVPDRGAEDQVHDLKEVLDKALNRIPSHYKSVILLRDYEGYSYKEIGEILELNEAQVKINIYRARVALKAYIGSVNVVI